MQTFPTHAVAGIFTSSVFLQNNPTIQGGDAILVIVAGIIGAIIPDLVMAPLFLYDKLTGRPPMSKQGNVVIFLKEFSHSILLWMILLNNFQEYLQYRDVFTVFAFGGLSHLATDLLTHAKKDVGADQSFTFPFNYLGFKVRWPFESWDYRYGTGILWPLKPWEMGVNIILTVTSALSLMHLF